MQRSATWFLLTAMLLPIACSSARTGEAEEPESLPVTRVDMTLSAFGVESDDFPSIEAHIDLEHNRSTCSRSYYNPAYQPSSYQLTEAEMQQLRRLLQAADVAKLKTHYTLAATDQPTSTTIIYTAKQKFVIKDYGLAGEYPLRELYKLVYKY